MNAIIILHEIYGVNSFIKKQCQIFAAENYDVFCPDLLKKTTFSHEDSAKAYDFFFEHVGFSVYTEILELIDELKQKYDNVFVLGFSVGATIAWRCCETSSCDGIIACYGSRIRDFTNLCPACPTLLVLANEDSFQVSLMKEKLQGKPNLFILEYDAGHGFLDDNSISYNEQLAEKVGTELLYFLDSCRKRGPEEAS